MSLMFDAIKKLMDEKGERPVIVVAGGGQWALQYARALHWFIVEKQIEAVFLYDSEYGLGQPQYHRYLKNTLVNMIEAEQLGALCIDRRRLEMAERESLPGFIRPKAVFVVTPPEKHCKNAIEWSRDGKTDYIFIEKPFDADPEAVTRLKENIAGSPTRVFGFDHYAARLKPFLTRENLDEFGFGECTKFVFEMFEAEPRGLEERAPSIANSGMIFDMASHALPVLSWLAEDLATVPPFEVYASTLLSRENRPYIRSETFGKITFQFAPKQVVGSGNVSAEIRVGKGVGAADRKFVILTDQNGNTLHLDQWFMLARFKEQVEPIHEKVIHRLVEQVISGDPSESDGVFSVDLGRTIVDVLVSWTDPIKNYIGKGNTLKTYTQGMTCDQICERRDGTIKYANVF